MTSTEQTSLWTPEETDMTAQAPKVAIITGSSRGIGASIAKRLAANGLTVIVNYAGRAVDADQVVTDITAQGGKAVAIQADVSVPAQVAALFDQATAFRRSRYSRKQCRDHPAGPHHAR